MVYHPDCDRCHDLLKSGMLGRARERFGSRLRWWMHDVSKPETKAWERRVGVQSPGVPAIILCTDARACSLKVLGVPDEADLMATLEAYVNA